MTADFLKALPVILKHEGGYVNDPDDTGGATNKGITQAVYSAYRKKSKQPEQAVKLISSMEVESIYFYNYWIDGNCDKLPLPLALVHFDFCVNAGITQATKTLQRVIKTPADGKFGQATIDALNTATANRGVSSLVDAYSDERVAFYITITNKRPVNIKFLLGWFRRTVSTRNDAKA